MVHARLNAVFRQCLRSTTSSAKTTLFVINCYDGFWTFLIDQFISVVGAKQVVGCVVPNCEFQRILSGERYRMLFAGFLRC